MTQDRPNDRRDTDSRGTPAPTEDGQQTDHPDPEQRDPGAYVGREPERQAATIPGGVTSKDERVAAHSTQSGPTAAEPVPGGHREGRPADDQVREAGESG